MSIQDQLQQYSQEAYDAYENVSGEEIRRPDGSLIPGLGRDDVVDAYRHAYVSAVMAYDYNGFIAQVAGTAHEIRGNLFGDQEPGSRFMDEWNNAEGREIGGSSDSREEIAANVYMHYKQDNWSRACPRIRLRYPLQDGSMVLRYLTQ